MAGIKIGDLVLRKSYGCDMLFRVSDKYMVDGKEIFILNSIHHRLQADSQEEDLVLHKKTNDIDKFHIAVNT